VAKATGKSPNPTLTQDGTMRVTPPVGSGDVDPPDKGNPNDYGGRPMKICSRLLSAVFATLVVFAMTSTSAFTHPDAEPQVTPAPLIVEPGNPPVPDPISDPYEHEWKCKNVPNCPGGLKRDPTGKYVGCRKVLGLSGCVGECEACTGSTFAVDICVPGQHSNSCSFLGSTIGQAVNCGTTTYLDDCRYSATVPKGEPFATPNGCYCAGATRPSTEPCMIAPCTNPL
jgi:hypothetical protein